jgi:hypothetical protein
MKLTAPSLMGQPFPMPKVLSLTSIKQAILEQLDLLAQQGHQALLVLQAHQVLLVQQAQAQMRCQSF